MFSAAALIQCHYRYKLGFISLQPPPSPSPVHSLKPLCLSFPHTSVSFTSSPFMDLAYFEVFWRLKGDKETQRDGLLMKTDKRMRWRDREWRAERGTKDRKRGADRGEEMRLMVKSEIQTFRELHKKKRGENVI